MEKVYAVWLLKIFGAGSLVSPLLCERYGSFEKIYRAPLLELSAVSGITKANIEKMALKNTEEAEEVVAKCDSLGIDIVTVFDVKYPSALKNISNPPIVLFVDGQLPGSGSLCMAVVGSRKPSIYGLNMTDKISYELAKAGMVIVSGMARGIDSAAHRAAIRAGGKTVAVLGCGTDVVYPPENRSLKDLISKNGAVVSEFLPGTAPKPSCFPVRNRIVSGMSDATLITEGKASSGSTITANLAKDQGREVFCLPGNADNPLSAAPNRFIREGARLAASAEDILIDMAVENPSHLADTIYSSDAEEARRKAAFSKLTSDQRAVAEVLSRSVPAHIDKICFDSGVEIAVVNQCLFMLELNGMVKQLPGKQYILCL